MGTNYYLRAHVYLGHESTEEQKFVPFEPGHAARRAIPTDSPFLHICKAADSLYWVMRPDHVMAFVKEHLDEFVVMNEYGGEQTGQGFWEVVSLYDESQWVMKLGRELF